MTYLSMAPLEAPACFPEQDAIVLRNRPLRATADRAALSRFRDSVWYLGPAQRDDQTCPHSLNWQLVPDSLRDQFKTFTFAMLEHRWPAQVAPALIDDQPAILTVHKTSRHTRFFACWLDTRGLTRIGDVGRRDLELYLKHVRELRVAGWDKARILSAVRTLWGYRDLLPPECRLPPERPWGAASAEDLVGFKKESDDGFNKTPRIAPATMEPLLAWALRMVEEFAPDIRSAFFERQVLMAGTHPAMAGGGASLPYALEGRLRWYMQGLHAAGRGLPGKQRQERNGGGLGVDHVHIARMIGTSDVKLRPKEAMILRLADEYGLDVESDAYFLGTTTAQVNGMPWRTRPFGIREINRLVRHLTAACFIVICYLSGLRPGEALQLRRGALQQDSDGQYILVGRIGKGPGRFGIDQQPVQRTWAVVGTLAAPVAVLESLSDDALLFPPSRHYINRARAQHELSMSAGEMNNNIRAFIDWVNEDFARPDGHPVIPPDPTKPIHSSRFRRTLAYFVVRRPGGLAAAALQYGHVRSKVTLSYAGAADTGWLEDVAIEQLEMLVEDLDEDVMALEDGEHVSGPSAQEYRKRVRTTAVFLGRVVNQSRNAQRLLDSANHNIHHGLAMTCVWRYETAACRDEHEAAGLDPSEPNRQLCHSDCLNLAYTDRNVEQLREDLAGRQAAASDALSPRPLRDRAATHAAKITEVIDNHDRTRPGATGAPTEVS